MGGRGFYLHKFGLCLVARGGRVASNVMNENEGGALEYKTDVKIRRYDLWRKKPECKAAGNSHKENQCHKNTLPYAQT